MTNVEYKTNLDRVVLQPGKFTEVEPDVYEAGPEGGMVDIWHVWPQPEPIPPGNKQPHNLEPGDRIRIIAGGNGIGVKITPA